MLNLGHTVRFHTETCAKQMHMHVSVNRI